MCEIPCAMRHAHTRWRSRRASIRVANPAPFIASVLPPLDLAGNTTIPRHQSSPQCSGTCPSRYFCESATVVPQLCEEGAYCAQGSARPTLCPPGTYGARKGLASQSQCTPCEPGYWCRVGQRYNCSFGTFNPATNADSQQQCQACPAFANTSTPHATQLDECQCDVDYFDMRTPFSSQQSAQCTQCFAGTACATRGVTLPTLPLVAGHYRPSPYSTDVRRCPDANVNCSTELANCDTSASGCIGGNDVAQQCEETLHGVFCLLCKEDHSNTSARKYYVRATASRQAHCEACDSDIGESVGIGVAVVVGTLVALGLATAGVRCAWRGVSEATRKQATTEFVALISRYTPQNKIKILLGFYVRRACESRAQRAANHFPPRAIPAGIRQ